MSMLNRTAATATTTIGRTIPFLRASIIPAVAAVSSSSREAATTASSFGRTSSRSSSSSSSSSECPRAGRIARETPPTTTAHAPHHGRRALASLARPTGPLAMCAAGGGGSGGQQHIADPNLSKYRYWNRETSEKGLFATYDEDRIVRRAKIVSLADPNPTADGANGALHDGPLPMGATLLGVGRGVQDFDLDRLRAEEANVVFISPSCPKARAALPKLLKEVPSLEWVHARSAGLDFVVSDDLSASNAYVTNAKGQFSSTLAEYTMMACSYFAKDLPRLMRQKRSRNWEKYDVEELRGKTLGVVGYGDIGRACARLASVYGMRIAALRRNPELCDGDPLCDVVYGNDADSLNMLMRESDYVVCSAPSTRETKGMVGADAFRSVKEGAVFINLGRGPVVDEAAMIEALRDGGRLRGAALDVFAVEPLPEESELWSLDNVLISPHNMDQTATFMHEATEFFVNENLPRFICGEELLNPVDKVLGY